MEGEIQRYVQTLGDDLIIGYKIPSVVKSDSLSVHIVRHIIVFHHDSKPTEHFLCIYTMGYSRGQYIRTCFLQ
jgi:hypothetical protein